MKKKRQGQAAPKKINVSRKKHLFNNVEQIIGLLFLVGVLGVSYWIIYSINTWMDNPERVVLSKLILTGERRFTTEDDVQQSILSLGLPDTFVSQNVDIVQQEILRLPWIKQVSVRKQWPDKLILNIVEHIPYVYWNDVFLLDKSGMIFSLPLDRMDSNQNVTLLYGPEDQELRVLEYYNIFKDILNRASFKDRTVFQIYSITANERDSWQIIMQECLSQARSDEVICLSDEKIKLILGRENLKERFERFIEFYPKIKAATIQEERIVSIDLRYNNGIAVQREKLSD